MHTRGIGALIVAIVVLTASITLGGAAMAQGAQPDWSEDLYERLAPMAETYNQHVDSVDLGIAGNQLKNRYTNLYVSGPGGTATYSFYMDDNLHISDLRNESNPEAKLRMTTDTETIDGIIQASNPAMAFRNAVANDDIVIRGEDGHHIEQVKWAIINALKGFFL